MSVPSEFAWPVRVYWEDTDAGGVVFYANYLRFFERARTEWLRGLGIEQQRLREETGGLFVVSGINLRYLRPARLDDSLEVTSRILEVGRASLTLQQEAWRSFEGQRAQLLCEGQVRIGWVNGEGMKPARIPTHILETIAP